MQKSSEIQSQKDHIHYLKSEKAKLSKLKEEQENDKEKLQLMETNETNFRSCSKTPDQMSKKNTQNPENTWRNQSRDRSKSKPDTEADMTDISTPTSTSEPETKEQPKKENIKNYNTLDSSQGYYKQYFYKDYQKPA